MAHAPVSAVLDASAFSQRCPDVAGTHIATRWQIAVKGTNFADPLIDTGWDAVNLLTYTTGEILVWATTYQARVCYLDNFLQASAWSDPLDIGQAWEPTIPCSLLLEVYKLNGTEVEWDCSTDPEHPNPVLLDPAMVGGSYGEQEVDFIQGRASISATVVTVLDRQMGTKQDRWLTQRLASAGRTAIMGRRCRLRRWRSSEVGWVTIADGPAGPPRLRPSYAGYDWEIRDTRENERKLRAFTSAETMCILPRGVLNGYGLVDGEWLAPPIGYFPMTGVVQDLQDGYNCFVNLKPYWYDPDGEAWPIHILNDTAKNLLKPTPPLGIIGDMMYKFDKIKVLWRYHFEAGYNPWREVYPNSRLRTTVTIISTPAGEGEPGIVAYENVNIHGMEGTADAASSILLTDFAGTGDETLPPMDAVVDIAIVPVNQPASESNPLHIESTVGQLLKDLYDGVYSPRDENGDIVPTGIRYDSDALAALTTPVRCRITEAIDDLRDWTEKNIYRAIGYAPALDYDGRISPVAQYPPPTFVGAVEISDSVTTPSPGWQHGDQIINEVMFTYKRDYKVSPESDPSGQFSGPDGIGSRDITLDEIESSSLIANGAKQLKVDCICFRAVGAAGGQPLTTAENETAYALWRERAQHVLGRLAWGAPVAQVKVMRSATVALRAGSWVLVSPSWMPNYDTGQRGINQYGQVLSVRDLNCAHRELVIEVCQYSAGGASAKGAVIPAAGVFIVT